MIYCSCSCLFDEYCGTSLSEGWCADSPKCALDFPICPKSFTILSASISDCWNKCQLCPFTQLQSRNEQLLGKVVIVFHPFLQDVLPNRSLEARQPDFAGNTPFCTSPTLDHFSCAKSVDWSTYFQVKLSSTSVWEWASRQPKTSSRASALSLPLRLPLRMARSLI